MWSESDCFLYQPHCEGTTSRQQRLQHSHSPMGSWSHSWLCTLDCEARLALATAYMHVYACAAKVHIELKHWRWAGESQWPQEGHIPQDWSGWVWLCLLEHLLQGINKGLFFFSNIFNKHKKGNYNFQPSTFSLFFPQCCYMLLCIGCIFQNLLATQLPKCLDLLLSSFIASPLWSWQSRTESDSAMWWYDATYQATNGFVWN